VGAAYLYVRSVDAEQGGLALIPRPVKPTAAVSVRAFVLGLLRQIAIWNGRVTKDKRRRAPAALTAGAI